MYVIMARLDVNWAQIIFDNLMKEHTTFLPYGAYLTHIFKIFKVDLVSKTNVIKTFELFDHFVLLRMKLFDTPSQPSTQPPPRTHSQRPSQSTSSHFDDAYYNTLTAEVKELKTQLLAQWPSTLVLMMINTHVVMFTNILVFLSFRSLNRILVGD